MDRYLYNAQRAADNFARFSQITARACQTSNYLGGAGTQWTPEDRKQIAKLRAFRLLDEARSRHPEWVIKRKVDMPFVAERFTESGQPQGSLDTL